MTTGCGKKHVTLINLSLLNEGRFCLVKSWEYFITFCESWLHFFFLKGEGTQRKDLYETVTETFVRELEELDREGWSTLQALSQTLGLLSFP